MLQYTNDQLVSLIVIPVVNIVLIWTLAIFYKNRRKWTPYDIVVFATLFLSLFRNTATLVYVTFLITRHHLGANYCSAILWTFNSIHTFQASCLSTLAAISLFAVRLKRKEEHMKQYLTPTHVVYHLFCLATLSACVGVAAVLAQAHHQNGGNRRFVRISRCDFLPYELDIKYGVFVVALHLFLFFVSVVSSVLIVANLLKTRKRGFDYLKKSTSDLSDLSLTLSNNHYYYDTKSFRSGDNNNFRHIYEMQIANGLWNSDVSNMTVSSVNSKKPCLKKEDGEDEANVLRSVSPILLVCYCAFHLPVIVFCIQPSLSNPWPLPMVLFGAGQLQDMLMPIGLAVIDSRFCKWVSKVYRCTDRHEFDDKVPPGVGLDGKFRHFGSQPPSLDVNCHGYPIRTEPKFPITNGSLYTSIDGRLPIIHNYRRHKDHRGIRTVVGQPLNVNRHASYLRTCTQCTEQQRVPQIIFHRPQRAPSQVRTNPIDRRIGKAVDNLSDIKRNPLMQPETDEKERTVTLSSDDDEEELQGTVREFDESSITTEANGDFDFYCNEFERRRPSSAFKITRSNSKLSLENFQAYVSGEVDRKMQRSTSCASLDERLRLQHYAGFDVPKMVDDRLYYQDLCNNNFGRYNERQHQQIQGHSESVPDFRKFFISEYL